MKRYGFLWQKIVNFHSLMTAAKQAARSKTRRPDVAEFMFNCENQVLKLEKELRNFTYTPRPFSTFYVKDPKKRMICASDFRDRVVHHALCSQIEPIFEMSYIFDSYACRKEKGTHKAVSKAQIFIRKLSWFLKCDIRKFFDNVNHSVLKSLIRNKIKDRRTLDLIDKIIDHNAPGQEPGKGLPIGNLTSQHFANFYLNELDHFIKENLKINAYIRYMDDFILFKDSKSGLKQCLPQIKQYLTEILELELKERATIMAPVTNGVPFLGFRIYPGLIRVKRENLKRSIRRFKRRENQCDLGLISHEKLKQSAGSIIAHLSHADSLHLRRRLFYTCICEG